jgi:hypothetical protein
MFFFQIVTLLATLTASTLATPVSVFDHYAPVKIGVAHAPVAIARPVAVAHHEAVEVEHYVSAPSLHD